MFGSSNAGLTGAQLSHIKFADFVQGAAISSIGEVTPLRGDINQDGSINVADISALTKVLTDENSYQAAHSFTASDSAFILDVDGDGHITNADLQGLLNFLRSNGGGAGSRDLTPVPEPTGIVLLALGGLIIARRRMLGVL